MLGQCGTHLRTFRRRIDLPGDKLSVLFLGGFPCDVVPLLFGELFTAVLYDGVLIDPGSPRMRGSLAGHLRRLPEASVCAVAATHHHEEHVGNLNWAAQSTSTPLYLSAQTAALLASPWRLPWVRAAIIGQPEPLTPPFEILQSSLQTRHGELGSHRYARPLRRSHRVVRSPRKGSDRGRCVYGQLLRHAESRRRQL